jgi:small subunit ribosomal protein S5
VRAVLDMIGVQDCLTKVYGSSNPKNVVKATMEALATLRTREQVEALRGVSIPATSVEEAIKRGAAFMPSAKSGEKMAAPKNTVGEGERRGGRGGRGGPRGPRRDGGGFGGGFGGGSSAGAAPSAPAPAPASGDAPAPEAGA